MVIRSQAGNGAQAAGDDGAITLRNEDPETGAIDGLDAAIVNGEIAIGVVNGVREGELEVCWMNLLCVHPRHRSYAGAFVGRCSNNIAVPSEKALGA